MRLAHVLGADNEQHALNKICVQIHIAAKAYGVQQLVREQRGQKQQKPDEPLLRRDAAIAVQKRRHQHRKQDERNLADDAPKLGGVAGFPELHRPFLMLAVRQRVGV